MTNKYDKVLNLPSGIWKDRSFNDDEIKTIQEALSAMSQLVEARKGTTEGEWVATGCLDVLVEDQDGDEICYTGDISIDSSPEYQRKVERNGLFITLAAKLTEK